MGSVGFEHVVYTKDSAEQAYESLVEEALHNHGHDPYNGTISTTNGVRVVPSRPLTLDEANDVISERLNNLRKWDVCEALPLVEETLARWETTGTHDVTLTLTAAELSSKEKVLSKIAKHLGVRRENVEILWSDTKESTYSHTATTNPGKPVTRYFVIPPTANWGEFVKWERGFKTMAQARAAIRDGSAFGAAYRPDQVEVIAITRREDGSALIGGKRTVVRSTVTYHVNTRRLITPAKVGKTQAGWFFYGWAAC